MGHEVAGHAVIRIVKKNLHLVVTSGFDQSQTDSTTAKPHFTKEFLPPQIKEGRKPLLCGITDKWVYDSRAEKQTLVWGSKSVRRRLGFVHRKLGFVRHRRGFVCGRHGSTDLPNLSERVKDCSVRGVWLIYLVLMCVGARTDIP